MAVISKGQTFATGDQVTALKLNNLADNATFASGAVDNVSTQLSGGAIVVKDGGVTTAKIVDGNITTSKIADSNVTKGKMENVANMKVLGNTSGSSAAPQEVSILDEDDMASDSNTSIPTQQSVKAYVDGGFSPENYSGEESITFPNGLIIKMGIASITADTNTSINFGTAFNSVVGSQITMIENTNADRYLLKVASLSETNLTIRNSMSTTFNAYWTVYGY